MYGAEDRITRQLEEKGYQNFYISANWDKLRKKEIKTKATLSEHELEKELDGIIKDLEK